MYDQKSLLDIPNHEESLIFYKVMNYPIPTQSDYFLFETPLDPRPATYDPNNSFSRHKHNPYMEEYVNYINKF